MTSEEEIKLVGKPARDGCTRPMRCDAMRCRAVRKWKLAKGIRAELRRLLAPRKYGEHSHLLKSASEMGHCQAHIMRTKTAAAAAAAAAARGDGCFQEEEEEEEEVAKRYICE